MPSVYIGIDPGASGGLARLDDQGSPPAVCKMPAHDQGLLNWLLSHKGGLGVHTWAVLEHVGGWVNRTEGTTGAAGRHRGSTMFTFGANYGSCRMACLAALGHEALLVTPQVWQATFIPPRGPGETRADWKNHLKQVAQGLFPGITVTLHTADALLLAEYCRRRFQGMLGLRRQKGEVS